MTLRPWHIQRHEGRILTPLFAWFQPYRSFLLRHKSGDSTTGWNYARCNDKLGHVWGDQFAAWCNLVCNSSGCSRVVSEVWMGLADNVYIFWDVEQATSCVITICIAGCFSARSCHTLVLRETRPQNCDFKFLNINSTSFFSYAMLLHFLANFVSLRPPYDEIKFIYCSAHLTLHSSRVNLSY